jgi:hypothetical protein
MITAAIPGAMRTQRGPDLVWAGREGFPEEVVYNPKPDEWVEVTQKREKWKRTLSWPMAAAHRRHGQRRETQSHKRSL